MTYEKLIEMYSLMHVNGAITRDPYKGITRRTSGNQIFYGECLYEHKDQIKAIINEHDITTVLDYGCGKALTYDYLVDQHSDISLREYMCIKELQLYDPAIEKYSSKPVTNELVLCLDVMEHLLEQDVKKVLTEINSLSTKVVYFSIHTGISSALLPNGENTHLTIKPHEWWDDIIKKYISKPYVLSTYDDFI